MLKYNHKENYIFQSLRNIFYRFVYRSSSKLVGLKVKNIGVDSVAMKKGKIYDVISFEDNWYRIMTEIHEDYLFPPELFEIVEE